MKALNKNKEEIERLKERLKSFNKSDNQYYPIYYQIRERIKTSILLCEDYYEDVKNSSELIIALYKMDKISYDSYLHFGFLDKRKEQLQTHLTWLKEQEKKQ